MPAKTIHGDSEAVRLESLPDERGRDAPQALVLFRVGELRLGIDMRHVREVARAVPPSVPLPGSSGVAGMITLRGESAVLVDLHVVLGVSRESRDQRAKMIVVQHNGAPVCLLVDRIEGLRDVVEADLEAPPAVACDVGIQWLAYVTRSATGDLIGVVDLDRMLSQTNPTGMGLAADRV